VKFPASNVGGILIRYVRLIPELSIVTLVVALMDWPGGRRFESAFTKVARRGRYLYAFENILINTNGCVDYDGTLT